ncbi:MAG TPA: FecR family protein [Bdellovibrionales bacterium]|nr:FecR family protein [Bdellovibrionales bacterium]
MVRLLLVSALALGFAEARAEGVFMVVKGDIKVEKAGKASPAKVGMKVMPGDTVLAGKDARAKIVMKDKNVLNISPESKILIEKYVANEQTNDKNVVLNVLYGKVRSTVNQKYDGEKNKFHVKTPSAVAGVRGTDFISSYRPEVKKAEFITFEGRVEVGKLDGTGQIVNSVMVDPGQMTSTIAGAPPQEPTEVPKNELAKLETDSSADKSNSGERQPANEQRQPESDKNKNEKKQPESNQGATNDQKNQDQGKSPEGDKSQQGDSNKRGSQATGGPGAPRGSPGAGVPGGGPGNAQGEGYDNGQGAKAGYGDQPGKPGTSSNEGGTIYGGANSPNGGPRDPASLTPGPLGPPPVGGGECMFCGVEGPIGGDYANVAPPPPIGDFLPPLPPPMPGIGDVYRPPDDLIRQNRTLLLINVVYQ